MSAAEALRLAKQNGIRILVTGADLILDADREPAPRVLKEIRRHKQAIVALLTAENNGRPTDKRQAFNGERSGIARLDSRQIHPKEGALAVERNIDEWLKRHPCPSEPGQCAWCDKADRDGHAVVPFGIENRGHTWLHPECWNAWHQARLERARRSLATRGAEERGNR